jgi:peptidoglycan/xylan/chitin deacetylase (PgdA/CDA1 family)
LKAVAHLGNSLFRLDKLENPNRFFGCNTLALPKCFDIGQRSAHISCKKGDGGKCMLKRKWLSFFLAIAAVISAGIGFVLQHQTVLTDASQRRLPVYSVETDQKAVALTFDAAWGNSDTDVLIAMLAQYQVKATFFVTGDWCDRCPEDVKKLSQAGHAIENHSDAHPHPNALSQADLAADARACNRKIEALTGIAPKLYRAPYGEYNDTVIATIEDTVGLTVVQWDADSVDWKRIGAEASAQNVISKVQNGSILLFHNDLETTVDAVSRVIERLQAQGYQFVLARDLIYEGNYKIDAQGRQFLVESGDS